MKADLGTGGGLSLSGLKFGGGDKKSKKKAATEDPRTREQVNYREYTVTMHRIAKLLKLQSI